MINKTWLKIQRFAKTYFQLKILTIIGQNISDFSIVSSSGPRPIVHDSCFNLAKPGCPSRCGDVIIPYPFGIGSNCSFNSWFDITCNTSQYSPYPALQHFPTLANSRLYGISNISLSNISARMPKIIGNLFLNLSGSPFSLSQTNVLRSFGCSNLIVLEGNYRRHNVKERNFTNGCISVCLSETDGMADMSCPGSACCKIRIPDGTVILNVSISDMKDKFVANTTTTVLCSGRETDIGSYLVSQGGNSNLESDYLQDDMMDQYIDYRSVMLDWRIGTERCSHAASNSTSFACGPNTICIDPVPMQGGGYYAMEQGFGGYRCGCKEGYQGNPYLPQGCTDVDECESNPCPSTGICLNTPGSYACLCPPGYYSDRSNANGELHCYQLPHLKLSKLAIGLISGISFLALLSFTFGITKLVKKKHKQNRNKKLAKQNSHLLLEKETSASEGILKKTRFFTAKELEKSTDRFNESRILGQGGQGTVYKGMLANGQTVAIKKSKLVDEYKSRDHSVQEQFINEVVIMSQISHRSVVKLLGCCLETRIPLLVYEFMPNGTLSDLIHGKNIEFPVSWPMRLKIAADVSCALAYLHSATSIPVFHRDIKSSNILLDEKFNAKVSDFGTSKSVEVDQTHFTTQVNGTFGYIDPEYFQSSQLTEKSDVYSFGVVLVELLTGLRPIIRTTNAEDDKSLVSRFLSIMEDENLELILESQVAGEGEKKEVMVVAELAKRCLHLNGKKRPTMKEVAMELETVRKSQLGSADKKNLAEDSMFRKDVCSTENSDYIWTNISEFSTLSSSDRCRIRLDSV